MEKLCNKCGIKLQEGEFRYFGQYDDNKKVWCVVCWKELQEYLKKKYIEEKVPELKKQALEMLKDYEKNKKKFDGIVKETKKIIKKLNKIEIDNSLDITKQTEINIFLDQEETKGEIDGIN